MDPHCQTTLQSGRGERQNGEVACQIRLFFYSSFVKSPVYDIHCMKCFVEESEITFVYNFGLRRYDSKVRWSAAPPKYVTVKENLKGVGGQT